MWAICEMDVGSGEPIVHGVYFRLEDAIRECQAPEKERKCEIPFYVEEMELVSLGEKVR